jgi:hypothetical protein
MPLKKPVAGSDAPRPLKTDQDTQRYTPTPRRNPRPAPIVGIFDEPTRCLKINLEWWSHVSGMIDALSSDELWTGDDEEQARALREIAALLAYNNCGDDSVTPEEYEEASYNAMYRAVNDVAKQIVSGRIVNFSVGDDGTVSDPSEGADSVELPEDDPASQIDETESARAGGAIQVRRGINQLLTDMNTLYGVDATPDTTLSDAEFIISSKYKVDLTALNVVMTEYWADRAAAKVQLTTIDTFNLDSALYCKGISKQTINSLIITITAVSIEARQNAVGLVNALTDAQISDWYERGTGVPSTTYLDFSCVKANPETIIITAIGVNFTTLTQWKTNHRLKMTITGRFVDPANIKRDFWYYITAANVVSNVIASTNISVGAGVTKPSTTQVPYNVTGSYVFTIETAFTSAMVLRVDAGGVINAPLTGTITVLIEDLGEIT